MPFSAYAFGTHLFPTENQPQQFSCTICLMWEASRWQISVQLRWGKLPEAWYMWRQWAYNVLAKELSVYHPAASSASHCYSCWATSDIAVCLNCSKGQDGTTGTPPRDLWPFSFLSLHSWPFSCNHQAHEPSKCAAILA